MNDNSKSRYYYDYELDPQKLVNYDRMILERIRQHSHLHRAIAPSPQPHKIINIDHFVRSGHRRKDHTKVENIYVSVEWFKCEQFLWVNCANLLFYSKKVLLIFFTRFFMAEK